VKWRVFSRLLGVRRTHTAATLTTNNDAKKATLHAAPTMRSCIQGQALVAAKTHVENHAHDGGGGEHRREAGPPKRYT
jgi:hypothetical protein